MKAQQILQHIPSMLIPLFESGTLYFCATRDDWQKAHQALDADAGMLDRRGCANTFKAIDGSPDVYLLGVFDHSAATLAHESAHLVFDICEAVGVEVERGRANETFCYLLDKIVEFGSQYLTNYRGYLQNSKGTNDSQTIFSNKNKFMHKSLSTKSNNSQTKLTTSTQQWVQD